MYGDIEPSSDHPTGLFYRDMRHLSRWVLRLNGRQLDTLAGEAVEYDEAVFFLAEGTGTVYRSPTLSVVRRRHVGEGMHERLELTNHSAEPTQVELSLLFEADFADIYEVKDKLQKTGRTYCEVAADHTTLAYERLDFRRETTIRAADDAFFTDESLTFRLTLQAREVWQTEIEVAVATANLRPLPRRGHRPNMPASLDEWLAGAPRLDTDWDDLRWAYHRSLVDLAALRFYPDSLPGSSLPAAGLPWYMALFGRDSLITSYQTLPFVPEMCRTTLRALAAQQADSFDDFRDAEPGKIMHELRHGELTYFNQRPQSPYYGAADSTPLFLVVLDEYERWTGDTRTVRDLEAAARAALRWVEEYGDANRDGFIEYQTRNPDSGLENQCWKDSWNSVVYPDGTLAPPRRAPSAGVLGRPGAGQPARARRTAPAGRLPRGLLAGRRGLLRAGAGRQGPAGADPHLEHRAPVVERDRAGALRRRRGRAPVRQGDVLRLGRTHACRGAGALQPDGVPQRHGVAARQLVDRRRPRALRPARRGCAPSGGGAVRRTAFRLPPARGARRFGPRPHQHPGSVPVGVLAPGLGQRDPAAVAAYRPRAGAGQGPARGRRPAPARAGRLRRAARYPRPVGPRGRVRRLAARGFRCIDG